MHLCTVTFRALPTALQFCQVVGALVRDWCAITAQSQHKVTVYCCKVQTQCTISQLVHHTALESLHI